MSDSVKEKKIKEQFDRYLVDSKVATVGRIRDLLLSDEFMAAFVKKFFSTPVDGGIVALDSVSMAASMDKAKGESFSVIYEWAGKDIEVSE